MKGCLAGFLMLMCAAAGGASPVAWLDDFEAAKKQAGESGKPLIAYFHDPESLLCKRMEEQTFGSAILAKPLADFVMVRIAANYLLSSGGREATRLNIRQFPTVVFFDSKGNELDRFSGFKDAPEFLRAAVEAIDPASNYVMLKERLKKNPRDVEALYGMGRKYLRRGELIQSARYFDQVRSLDPDDAHGLADNLLLRRAERLQQESKFEQALQMIHRFEEAYPESDEKDYGAYLKARLLWLADRKAESLEAYREFVRQYPLSEFKPQALAALSALEGAELPALVPASNPALPNGL